MNQRLLEVLAGLLEPEEREAVLGDLAESKKSSYTSLRDLAGLVIRRQVPAWKRPGPWLVLLGVAVPVAVLININSGHNTDNFAFQAWQYFTQNGGLSSPFWLPLQCAELASWSWTAGIVIGTLARQTTRLNAILFCALTTLATFVYGPPFLPSQNTLKMLIGCIAIQVVLQTFLVMIPTIAGVRQSTGSTITILSAATLVLMPIHQLVGPFQIVHHNLDLACYLMVWPVLYWLATPLLRKRVTL